MLSKEEIKIDHTKDSFNVRIPLITEQEFKRIDDNLDSITDELTKQIIHDKELAIAQHIIQKQKERIEQLEQENNKQSKIIDEMLDEYEYNARCNLKNFCDEEMRKNKCIQDCRICIKQYFKKKVEEN